MPPTPPATAALPNESLLSPVPADALGGTTRTCTALDDPQTFFTGPGMLQRFETLQIEPKGGGAPYVPVTSTWDGPLLTSPGWSCIRPTASAEAHIAAPGVRIDPALHGAFMPVLRQGTTEKGTWQIKNPGRGIRIIGIDIAPYPNQSAPFANAWENLNALALGIYGDGGEGSTQFIVDRCYIHGQVQKSQMACAIAVGYVSDLRIINNYWTEWHSGAHDNPGVKCSGGPGIHLVENNYGNDSGVFYGGNGGAYDEAHVPKHIIVRRNTFECPRFVMGHADPNQVGTLGNAPEFLAPPPPFTNLGGWNVKALIEFKVVQYCLIEGNTFINAYSWPCVTLDAWEQPGTSEPFNRLEDVTVRHNVGQRDDPHYGHPVFFQLYCGNKPIHRVHIHNNLCWSTYQRWGNKESFGYQNGKAMPFFPQWTSGYMTDINIEHNTFPSDGGGILFQGTQVPDAVQRFRIANNIMGFGNGGYECDQLWDVTADSFWDNQIQDRDFKANAFVDFGQFPGSVRNQPYAQSTFSPANGCAAGQFFVVGPPADCGINATTGRLVPGSSLKAGGVYQATDQTDNGVNFDLLEAGLGGTLVQPPPIANFRSQQIPGSLTMNFTDLSNGAESWLWDFGNP